MDSGLLLEIACTALGCSASNMVLCCYDAVQKEEEREREDILDALELLLPLHLANAAIVSGALPSWPHDVPAEMQALCTYDSTKAFLQWSGIAEDWRNMCRFQDEILPLLREEFPDAHYEWCSVDGWQDA
jgi:hypothetical protein